MMSPVLSREEYLKLRGSVKQRRTVKAVREGDEKLKMRLVQMNYSCLPNDDGTLKGSTRISTTVGMDIDHIKAEEMEEVKNRILGKKDELGLLMMELSARASGYHLVFRRREELSQEENLRWASELLGVEFDQGAKDATRVFFTTTDSEEDLIFLDDGIFEVDEAVNDGEKGRSRARLLDGGAEEKEERSRGEKEEGTERRTQRSRARLLDEGTEEKERQRQLLTRFLLRNIRGFLIRRLSPSIGSCSTTVRSRRRATAIRLPTSWRAI